MRLYIHVGTCSYKHCPIGLVIVHAYTVHRVPIPLYICGKEYQLQASNDFIILYCWQTSQKKKKGYNHGIRYTCQVSTYTECNMSVLKEEYRNNRTNLIAGLKGLLFPPAQRCMTRVALVECRELT